MAQGSSQHDNLGMSAELPQSDQDRAITHLAAAYREANRPPLTETERREREGDIILPVTPEMRAEMAQLSAQIIVLPYIIVVVAIWLGIVFIAALLKNYSLIVMFGPPVLAVPLYVPFARWMRARRTASVNRLQTYHRYAGQCEIEETHQYRSKGSDTYRYLVKIESPPAPVTGLAFAFRYGERHKDVCAVTWGTIEYLDTRDAKVLSIRNDHDQIVYRYADTL